MIIEKGTLLYVSKDDLDEQGVLRIPEGVTDILEGVGSAIPGLRKIYFPDSMSKINTPIFEDNYKLDSIYFVKNISFINYAPFKRCPNIKTIHIPNKRFRLFPLSLFENLKTIVVNDKNLQIVQHLKKYSGKYYYESNVRNIGNIRISKVQKVDLTTFYDPSSKVCLNVGDKKQYRFIEDTLSESIKACRKYLMLQEFDYYMWKYKATHKSDERIDQYQTILRDAISKYISNKDFTFTKANISKVKQHIQKIPIYIKYIKKYSEEYTSAQNCFGELSDITIDNLLRKIKPVKRSAVKQSCTRWLKSRPVSSEELTSIALAGYKNPGAFPYSWIKKIPTTKRGSATKQLHKLFKQTTTQLYTPDNNMLQPYINKDILRNFAEQISKIIKQEIEIRYLGSGTFSKTYTLQIPGDKKYVWKIYHCDTSEASINSYYHDTELQNSFLIGGKKYLGQKKFRKISTAGISNQRGQIYLIYPYTEAKPIKNKIHRPFEALRKYSLLDKNCANFLGNTIIDLGALRINYSNLGQSKHISKITNTILYHSKNELIYVLNNYTSTQINDALNFINERISINHIEFSAIKAKIEFLKQKANIR